MHQANMAKNVSKFIFQAAHAHNWFWADGWVNLLIETIRQTEWGAKKVDTKSLANSFQLSKGMTECFSSIREAKGGPDENNIVRNIVNQFKISEKQAKEIVWISKRYSNIFPEIELMRQNTDMGTKYSKNVISLITERRWTSASDELIKQYQNMRDEEAKYSAQSFIITTRADRIYLIFFGIFCFFVFLLSLQTIRFNHRISILKRMKVEDKLRDSKELYQNLFEMESDALATIDVETGKIIAVNQAFIDLYGFRKEECIQMKNTDFSNEPEKTKKATKDLKKVVPVRWHKKKNGSVLPVEIVANTFNYRGKDIQIAAIRDITERKKVEKALQEKQTILESNIKYLKNIDIISKSVSQSIKTDELLDEVIKNIFYIFQSDRAWLLYPCDPESPTFQIPIEYTKPEYPGALTPKTDYPIDEGEQQLLSEILSTNEVITYDLSNDAFRNSETVKNHYMKSQMVVAIHPGVGSPWVMGMHQCSYERVWTQDEQSLFKDISLRVKDALSNTLLLSALQESEQKYRIMMESMKDAAYICSSERYIKYMNPAMIKMVGKGVIDEFCYKTIYGRDEKCSWCILDRVKKGEKVDYEVFNPKNSLYYSVSNSPIFHADGSISKLTIFHDITKIKNIEAQLQQAQKMESIGNLAGGIAHDFNNLLFPIIGMSEMLLEDLPSDSLEYENAQEIFNAGRRAGDLVKQILTFSRQSEHKMTATRLQNILKEVLKLSHSTLPTNIEFNENIQQNCGLVMADPTQIHQIAMNLITNSFHAIEGKNGVIDIELKEVTLEENELPDSELLSGEYVRLSVSDNGTGMTQNTINNIFEPYYTTKKKGKGTGLGLAVVYGIVKEHNGDIKVYSELGEGSTFHIYLPLMEKTSKIETADQAASIEAGTEKILLVDDEKSVAKLEGKMLSRLGYLVTEKTKSSEALNTFKMNPENFDLVITDMTMPDMTGDQLAKEILSIKPNTPIIICTGFSERINKEQAEIIGVKGFLMKPVEKSDMAKMVREVLDEAKK